MSKALVIGNGESRRGIDLEIYRTTHTLIGCNAIHRDLVVDHLICCDRRMGAEATENPLTKDKRDFLLNGKSKQKKGKEWEVKNYQSLNHKTYFFEINNEDLYLR